MKLGRTLSGLTAEVERQACAKRDFLAPSCALHVQSNGHTDVLLEQPFALNEVAHSQLADYLAVPRGFYDRLRNAASDLRVPLSIAAPQPVAITHEDGVDDRQLVLCEETPLFDVLVNRLLVSKGSEGRLIRTLDGKARAFLSSSFNTDLDNWDVMRVAAKVITEAGLEAHNVASCEVTDRRLYLKVLSPKLEAIIHPSNLTRPHGDSHYLKEPQVVQAGFVLMNSEVGLGALSIQQTVCKLMCTNLWIKEEAYRQRHVGKVLEADEEGVVYKSDTRLAEAKARLLKLRDHVAEALDEHRFRALVGKMQETTEVKLEGGIEKIVEVTARKFGLNQAEKEETLQHLIEGADLSLWGLTNAITQTAQHVLNYDRATELEAIGGRFFSLPAREIKEIVRAA